MAKVVLPIREVTISARAKCYPEIVNHVQVSGNDGELKINFVFSNANRKSDCEDEDVPAAVHQQPVLSLAGGPPKLAWVISNSAYDNGWPSLDFVENDKTSMVALLSRAGFQIITSANRSQQQLLTDERAFLQRLMAQTWRSVIVYISGHGVGLNGQNYFVPADAPGNPVGDADLFPIARIERNLHPLVESGMFGMILVDACRSDAGVAAHPMVAANTQGVPVNYSTSPGKTSFDSDRAMSAWTERFVTVAERYPWLGTDQLVMYADRYTKWQSAASLRVQTPVLYGRFPARVPPFGQVIAARTGPEVAALTQPAR
ncbi:MAG: caspase family protein [Rhodopila sp.]